MATPPSKPVKTVTINYTDPAPGQSTQLQILNDTAGNYGEIQFKGRSGNFAATNNLAWDGNTQTLNIRGNIRLTGTIVGNLVGNPSFLKLIGGNAGDVLTTDGEGNMSWLPAAETGYSNNDVGNYLANYTGNLRSGNANLGNAARANYFIGNLTGTAQYATTANNVAVANVAGIGNIATINLSGSNSNVLYGNGVWAPASRASENSISNGSTSVSIPSANGNVIVNVSNGTAQWRFGNDGNLTLPGNTFAINYANGVQVQLGGEGSPGPQGDPGPAGADGADALWNWQGAYSAGPQYQEGDIVTHLGSTYRRNGTGNSVVGIAPPDATYWELVAERGVAGNAGARGSIWTSGAADPSGTFFGLQEMDLYLNNTEGTVWQYVGGDWILLANITGPQGPQGDPGGNANTGNITFVNNILRNTTALGGEVNIETASQAGDPNKAWSFNHDGAGSLYVPVGSSIKSELGLSIVATDTGFINFTNVRDFDTNSYLDFDEISIVNPGANILDQIDPDSPNYAAGVGSVVRFVYANYLVQEAVVTEGFIPNGDDPFTGLPRYTGRINFNSTTMQDLIKEISFNNSANWRFTPDGKLYLPLNGEIIGAQSTDPNFPNGLIRLVPNEKDFPGGPDGYITFGQYIDIYPTNQYDTPHIHIAAGKGEGGNGSLILGDDAQNIEIRNDGSISIQSHDQLRNSTNYWYFNTNGALQGPGMGTLLVSGLSGAPGSDLNIYPGGADRFTSDIQFADADGSSKSVYTVDTNVFYIGNIPPIGGASLWHQNGSSVTINSIVLGSGTATFTFSDPVILNPNTSYTVEWPGVNTYDVRVQTESGSWKFKDTGIFETRGTHTKVSTKSVSAESTSDTVWTSSYEFICSAKLTVQLEADEVGDDTGSHTQVCEVVIATRGSTGTPSLTVYARTYTSTVPLATFSVQRNPASNLIELIATRTAETISRMEFRIHSVEMATLID